MIDRTEWQAASRALAASRRETLGDPPSAVDLFAYTRGELTPDEEERVREHLVCDPGLARVVARQPRVATHRVWQFATALAASIILVIGMHAWTLRQALQTPRVATEEIVLLPREGARGGAGATVVTSGDEPVLLVLPLPAGGDVHRVEIAGVWKSGVVRPHNDETLSIFVPRSVLQPGRYEVVLYDADGVSLSRHEFRAIRHADGNP